MIVRRVGMSVAMLLMTCGLASPGAVAAPSAGSCPVNGGTGAAVTVATSRNPVTVAVADTRTGAPSRVVVTFADDGTRFSLGAPTDARYYVTDGSWCVRAATATAEPTVGSGTAGTSPATTKKGAPQRIAALTLYTVTTQPPMVVCLDSSVPGTPDVTLDAGIDTRNNLTGYASTDGTCTAPVVGTQTAVVADSTDEAQAKCVALGTAGVDELLSDLGYTVPYGWWVCAPS